MKTLANAAATALAEFVGLFVEDRLFALAIAVWIGVAALVLHFANVDRHAAGIVFAAGFIAILLASVIRAARATRA